jgi:hypothetical protein
LHVVYVIDSLTPAGAECSLVDMVPGLRARGVDVDIVTLFDRPGLTDAAIAGGATVTCVAGGGGRLGEGGGHKGG